jgi:hypothetical protein
MNRNDDNVCLPLRGGLAVLVAGAIGLCATGAAAQPGVSVTIGVPGPPPVYYPPPPPPPVYYAPPPPPPPQVYYAPAPQPVPDRILRWGGGLKVSYGIPGGSAFFGQPLSDISSGMIDFEGAVDLVILRRIVVGANIGIGIGSVGGGLGSGCDVDDASCSVLDFDFGIHGEYRFLPDSWINPWVGAGLEYEILILSESVGGDDTSASLGGVDVDLSAGVDFQYKNIGGGPFISYRFGSYTSRSATENGEDIDNADIAQAEGHDWLMLGLRGRY